MIEQLFSSVRPEVAAAIALCALVTVIPRIVPFMSLRLYRAVSAPVIAWLRLLPASILAALLLPELLLASGSLRPLADIGTDLAACLAVICIAALAKNNLIASVLGGIAVFAVIQALV